MITEQMCVDVAEALHKRTSTIKSSHNLDNSPGVQPVVSESVLEHALPTGDLYRHLLPRYSLEQLDTTIRWLELCGYIGYTGYGFAPRMALQLTREGERLAESGSLSDKDRRLVYQEDPYAAFVARQFRDDDTPLFVYLEQSVLAQIGVKAIDGRVDGIEAFRGEILRKIRVARFFLCLLTRREELRNGRFASSVWLYQETGAAVALGKKPLVLVEDGLDDHFAGELQKNYEYIPFRRAAFEDAFQEVGRRLYSDLRANHIPVQASGVQS